MNVICDMYMALCPNTALHYQYTNKEIHIVMNFARNSIFVIYKCTCKVTYFKHCRGNDNFAEFRNTETAYLLYVSAHARSHILNIVEGMTILLNFVIFL